MHAAAEWKTKGCPVCRKLWETGEQPPMIATSPERHAHLHRCEVCGTLWEQNERFADVISRADAAAFYPDVDLEEQPA